MTKKKLISSAGQNKRRLKIVLTLTLTYLLAEVVGGILTRSLALIADAGHMLTDAGGIALSLFAINIASRPASPEKTYGYYRAEILASLTNAVILIVVSLYILYEAYQRFLDPPVVKSKAMLLVATIGFFVNIAGMVILKKSSTESLNMKGAYFEVLADMLTSIGVIVAGIIMLITGWYYADPLLSAGIGLFILPRTWILLKESVNILLEGVPKDVNIANLRTSILQLENVKELHDLHVWSLTSGVNAMSAHVIISNDFQYRATLESIHTYITHNFNIAHTTLQLESLDYKEVDGHQ